MTKTKIESEKKSEKVSLVSLPNFPSQQFVIPNSQELDLSVKCNRKIATMPYAVKTFKFHKGNINEMSSSGLNDRKEGYRMICNLHKNAKFLLHIQVSEGTEFTNSQLKFIEDVQDISETPYFCVYEKSFKGSAQDLRKQILDARRKFPDKEVVPVVEVYTKFDKDKVKVMKALEIKKCAVIYRNYKRYEREWERLMGLLDTANISRFVFGVYPRYRRKNKASILLAPLRFGAEYVAHGLAWSGGKGQVRILGNGWTYNVTQNSSYPASRVQVLNKANSLTNQIQTLSIEQIKTLLY